MRKLLLAASLIALASASAAFAGDISVTPQQSNHPWPAQTGATTVTSVTTGNKLTASGAGVGNIYTADSNGNLTVGGLNNYSASQSSDTTSTQAQTGITTVSATTVTYGGADLSSNGIGNQLGLKAAGNVYVAPLVTQQNTGHQVATTSVTGVSINGGTTVSAGATGNVLTAAGNNVTIANSGVFATQSTDHTRVSTANLTGSSVNGDLTVTSQAGANAIEVAGLAGGVSLATVQADGNGYGSGLNQISGYPGASEIAKANVVGVTVTSGNTSVGTTAFGNNLLAQASFGGSISGSFIQNGINTTQSAATYVGGSNFSGSLNASSLAVGNSAALKTN